MAIYLATAASHCASRKNQGGMTMANIKSAAAAAAAGAACGIVLAFSAFAGGDKIAFPEDYAKGTLYSTLDRHDNKQYRELWATLAAVEAARKGEPVASGTVLTLVQYKP